MKTKRMLYGAMGFLSLLGFIGVFSEARSFLAFFAFAVDFQYFFLPSDEMMDAYMSRSAARAFYCGMLATAAGALARFFAGAGGAAALPAGLALGWGVAVAVYALSTAYYGLREKWGLGDD